MLDANNIHLILEFLGRTSLSGNEVPAFVQCTNALHAERARLMAPPDLAPPAPVRPRRSAKARTPE